MMRINVLTAIKPKDLPLSTVMFDILRLIAQHPTKNTDEKYKLLLNVILQTAPFLYGPKVTGHLIDTFTKCLRELPPVILDCGLTGNAIMEIPYFYHTDRAIVEEEAANIAALLPVPDVGAVHHPASVHYLDEDAITALHTSFTRLGVVGVFDPGDISEDIKFIACATYDIFSTVYEPKVITESITNVNSDIGEYLCVQAALENCGWQTSLLRVDVVDNRPSREVKLKKQHLLKLIGWSDRSRSETPDH